VYSFLGGPIPGSSGDLARYIINYIIVYNKTYYMYNMFILYK
jgi:hypothetical protein